ncbi:FecR domain-containing protein [Sphingomonas sp. MG17]|uniref:FecR domain-containing protein n=1 Tax=Sphingomonas tagetis TaxID=2949092 RepID=A0A9X2HL61_9SPHN|nr:FecR domain-containing protein [Sphingomonas tagetis]MCP3732167.1 FecR domain-containing protein [Sphingomonas tagetis]
MTDSSQPHDRPAGQLTEEAAMWFARMRGPEAEAHRPEFDSWLARGALHRRAYNRAAEIFSMGKFLEAEPGAESAHDERGSPSTARKGALAGLAAIAIATAGAIAWQTGLLTAPTSRSDIAGRAGDQAAPLPLAVLELAAETSPEVETLVDGSKLTLSPNTRLNVRLEAARRTLWLIKGRARFEVAHEARPFTVIANGTQVVARGTVFDVEITPEDRVAVNLLRGAVDVTTPARGSAKATTMRLRPGQSIMVAQLAPGAATIADAPSVSATTAIEPTSALRDFTGVRLADLAAEANRYGPVPIRLAEPRLGNMRVSGSFRIDDTEKLAGRLAQVLDLRADRSDPKQITLSAR